MVTQATTSPKSAKKSKLEHKKYKKRQQPEEEELEVLEFVEDEEEETELEVIPPRGHISSGILTTKQNRIKENIGKTKLVCKGQLFHLPTSTLMEQPHQKLESQSTMLTDPKATNGSSFEVEQLGDQAHQTISCGKSSPRGLVDDQDINTML